jgi:type I restriction enzyme R subunit
MPAATAVYRNLPDRLFDTVPPLENAVQEPENAYNDYRIALALEIDRAMREKAPAGWKGDETREREVQNVLFRLLKRDREATLKIFDIIKNQPGY